MNLLRRVFSTDNLKEYAEREHSEARSEAHVPQAGLLFRGEAGWGSQSGGGTTSESDDGSWHSEEEERLWRRNMRLCKDRGCQCMCHADPPAAPDGGAHAGVPSPMMHLLRTIERAQRRRVGAGEAWLMLEIDGDGRVVGDWAARPDLVRADIYSTREAALAAALLNESMAMQQTRGVMPTYEHIAHGLRDTFVFKGWEETEFPYGRTVDEVLREDSVSIFLSRYMIVRLPLNAVRPFRASRNRVEHLGNVGDLGTLMQMLGRPRHTPLSALSPEELALLYMLRELEETSDAHRPLPCYALPPSAQRARAVDDFVQTEK